MQVFVSACSHILFTAASATLHAAPLEEDATTDDPEAPMTTDTSSGFAQTAAVATYATRIALNAVMRLSKLAEASVGSAGVLGAAFPLAVFIADVVRLQTAAFSGMHLLLEVLVATLKGAGQAEIEEVLPQILRFTVGSSEKIQVCKYVLFLCAVWPQGSLTCPD